jgi:hypothetical protein
MGKIVERAGKRQKLAAGMSTLHDAESTVLAPKEPGEGS